MNRREFTVSLGAATATLALPLPFAPAASAAPAAVPAATYKWAKLIARGRGSVTPALLARQLRLTPQAAQTVFHALLRDGVLQSPGALGIAQAVKPMQATGHRATLGQALHKRTQAGWQKISDISEHTQHLAKDADRALGCAETPSKDASHASTDQPVQEGPRTG